jgi:hypothetical protein
MKFAAALCKDCCKKNCLGKPWVIAEVRDRWRWNAKQTEPAVLAHNSHTITGFEQTGSGRFKYQLKGKPVCRTAFMTAFSVCTDKVLCMYIFVCRI